MIWWGRHGTPETGRADGRDRQQARRRQQRVEEAWQRQVLKLARLYRWRHYHTWLSLHSAAGFPDLVLVKPPRLLFAELKRDDEAPTAAQRAWLADLAAVPGVEVYVWRPVDAQQVADVLAGRGPPVVDVRAGPGPTHPAPPPRPNPALDCYIKRGG